MKKEIKNIFTEFNKRRYAFKILLILMLFFIFSISVYARDYEKEVKIGRKITERIEKQYQIVEDDLEVNRVQQIAERLREVSEIEEIEYQIKIIEKEEPNAFALPGGFIYLTSGLLEYVHSDDELAAVIAHEMGHIIHQHSIKQLQDKQKLKIVELLTILITNDPALSMLSELASITILNSYRREYEEEADLTALQLLQKSMYYHPVALLTYFERVNSEHILKPDINMGIFKTHPEVRDRIRVIKQYLTDNDIAIDRRLTTKYLTITGDYQEMSDGYLAKIIINDEPILYFVNNDEESIKLKIKEVTSKFNYKLRLDTEIYELVLNNLEEGYSTLSIGDEIIISISQQEVYDEDLTAQEALKKARDKIAKILWRLKLELPILLIEE